MIVSQSIVFELIQGTVDMVNQASMNRNSDFEIYDDYKQNESMVVHF